MAGERISCPSCGKEVPPGEVECPSCGTNVKTGQTFESRKRAARARGRHPEHFQKGLSVTAASAFAIVVMMGYWYQKSIEKVIAQDADEIAVYVAEIERIDALHDHGQDAQARKEAEGLKNAIESAIDKIIIKAAYGTTKREREAQEQKPYRIKKRRLLRNLKAKVEYRLAKLGS